ncbi:DinB family protein [Mucilaginibacter terrae]|uniref:DinB family protein n=1 Tax=Mucilaginibacter terrae TaxID=1955052 RepID=UPI00363E2080
MITQPQPGEFAPFYAGYVARAAEGDILQTLTQLKESTYTFFTIIPAEKEDFAYAPGKWTIKQVLNHIIDTERIFAFRLLCFARQDANAMPGFDENAYADSADVSARSLSDLATEFKALREANLYLYRSITPQQSLYTGMASGKVISIRSLLYIIAGHELHHLAILKERYL